MKKKYVVVVLCLLVASSFMMLGLFFINNEGYTLNSDDDFITVMSQVDSSFQKIKQIDHYDYVDDHIHLKIFAVVDQQDFYHFFVFQQRFNGKYDIIYNYSRSFEMAYCLNMRNTDFVIIGMPNYDGLGKRLEVLVENNASFFENIDHKGYIIKVYESKDNIVTAFLYDDEYNSIDYEMIFADIGGNTSSQE